LKKNLARSPPHLTPRVCSPPPLPRRVRSRPCRRSECRLSLTTVSCSPPHLPRGVRPPHCHRCFEFRLQRGDRPDAKRRRIAANEKGKKRIFAPVRFAFYPIFIRQGSRKTICLSLSVLFLVLRLICFVVFDPLGAIAPPADALNSVSSEATDLTPRDRGLRRNERGEKLIFASVAADLYQIRFYLDAKQVCITF
ncbi:hypothetical protein BHM03_00039345, partial [Ensete ventricosum]